MDKLAPKKILKSKLLFILLAAILLAAFYIFSFIVKMDLLTRFDFDMTVRIQNNIPIRFDKYLSYFSLIGSAESTLIILIILVGINRKIKGAFAVFLFALVHVVEIIGKAYLDHPVTPFMFHRYSLDFVFPTSYVQPGGSYPSGHSLRTVFLAIVALFILYKTKRLSKITKKIVTAGIVVFVAIMLISRISLGEHWTTDVIGGSLLGASFAVLSLLAL